MKRRLLVLAAMLAFLQMQAQETWSLRRCIDYALDNNIQVLTKELSRQSAEASLEQSKAQLYPTLSFSSSFGANFKNISTYNEYMEKAGGASVTNSFGLNSGMTLYQGGALRNSVLQQQVQNEAAGYDVEQSRMDIEMSVAQAYIQILYDKENLDLKKLAAELSASQVERGEALRQAGSISKVDLAQLKSQKASDEYQIVSAENQLSSDILKLKQLLELGLDEDFQPYYPEVSTLQIESEIPTIRQIYEYASEANPQMRSTALSVESADLGVKIAKGSYMPSIRLSAGISTGATSGAGTTYFDQLGNKLGESLGLSLSLPIFNGRQVRTSVRKAEIQSSTARLQEESQRKQLLSTLEQLHNDAVSSLQKYQSATAQMEASRESFNLVTEQFAAGIKNTVELMTEKNSYISALSQQLQAKYSAIFAEKLLKRYLDQPIEL